MKYLTSPFWKTFLSVLFALIMLGLGIHFLIKEGVQISAVKAAIEQSDRRWLYLGIGLSVLYIWLHGQMYRQSFRALGLRVGIRSMTRLYLKRNLVSVFLPAGFIASQVFFNEEVVCREKVQTRDVFAASTIFSVSALISMVVVVLPALGWMLTQHVLPGGAAEAFVAVSLFFGGMLWAAQNFTRRGAVYHWFQRLLPAFTAKLDDLDWSRFQGRHFLYAILLSCLVELVGTVHIYLAAKTLGADPSWPMAIAGYIAVLIVLMTSPFLRGIGAVEALLAFVLIRFGLPAVEAVSAAVLFRFFEFWLLLLLGIPLILFRPGSLVLRVLPSVLLFGLGVVNILSGLTPSLPERIRVLHNYLPLEAIHASAAFTITSGFLLLVTAFFLLRGLRNAWWMALALSTLSLISHLTKGFDYEEASLALITLGALVYQRRQYRTRTDLLLFRRGWLPALLVAGTTLLLGTAGFYLLNHRHFGIDFSGQQSVVYALQTFLLIEPEHLHPLTHFAANFLWMMHLLGGLTMVFAALAVFYPLLPRFQQEDLDRQKAVELVHQYGCSSLDYFKTYEDKIFFFPESGNAFIAYKSTTQYALALEDPVAPDEKTRQQCILEFETFCRRHGLKSLYYRIPSESVNLYRAMGKSLLPLGQEALVDLTNFNLEGKDRKALRNTVHRMEKEGFVFTVHEAPQRDGLLQQLRAVSDAWLRMLDRSELSFSQGIFKENELRQQIILTLQSTEGKVFAFINIIPGASPQEANFDLMRRTEDAPNGTMDYLFIKMFLALKDRGFTTCNLGLVPLSGVEHPDNLPEHLIKLAYHRIPHFANYRSLRFFKEKFDPVWSTKYLVYDNQMDLVSLPRILARVVRTHV